MGCILKYLFFLAGNPFKGETLTEQHIYVVWEKFGKNYSVHWVLGRSLGVQRSYHGINHLPHLVPRLKKG